MIDDSDSALDRFGEKARTDRKTHDQGKLYVETKNRQPGF
jgi:hypothetical protein